MAFTKVENDFIGTLELKNISSKLITYKVKTTSPDKFRVRPSNGILDPGSGLRVNVVLQPGHQISSVLKDKFLVMGMVLASNTTDKDIPDLWKNTPSASPNVEQHRLKCTVAQGVIDENLKNFTYSGKLESSFHNTSTSSESHTVS